METMIDLRGLEKNYSGEFAVNGIDLNVKRGELFGIVGPDGAGKSTLLKMLSCVEEPDNGKGIIMGYDYPEDLNDIKVNTGYLSEGFSLYRDLTVLENIEFFAGIYQAEDYRKEKSELLGLTGLKPFKERLADNLSGGMKQKLALICSLIHRPDIIFLDEPTTGVDPVSRSEFWKILAGFLRDGLTVVVNISYLSEAERCTRVAFMSEGEFLAVNTPHKLKEELNLKIYEIFAENLRGVANLLKQFNEIESIQFLGDRINVSVSRDIAFSSIVKVIMKKIEIDRWEEVTPTLDNVFVSLIKKEGGK